MNEREINFKYYWRDKSGSIKSEVISLDDFDDGENTSVTIDDEVLARCQFTGLQDKNGVDIYEGDVLSWMNSSIMIRGEVRFACGQFQVRPNDEVPFCFAPYSHRTEVIGNVYENPELIN